MRTNTHVHRQSGLAFEGVDRAVPVPTNGSEFLIGTLTHFNHAVFGWVERLQLTVNVTLNGAKTRLAVPIRIHETPNDERDCPYLSDRNAGCSDRVWFTAQSAPLPRALAHRRWLHRPKNEHGPLKLIFRGVRAHPALTEQELRHSFISQERRDSFIYLFAAIDHR